MSATDSIYVQSRFVLVITVMGVWQWMWLISSLRMWDGLRLGLAGSFTAALTYVASSFQAAFSLTIE